MTTTGRPRGFNASKEGFVTAPPVAVSPADPANSLLTSETLTPAPVTDTDSVGDVNRTFDAFASLTQLPQASPAVFVEEPEPVLRRFEDMSKEVRDTAYVVGDTMGVPKEDVQRIIVKADSAYPYEPSQDIEVIDPDIAASWVSTCMAGDPSEPKQAELLAKIRSGEVVLTRRELATLSGVRELIDERQARDLMDYAEGSEWVPFVETRRCTLCGQFIGERSSHSCRVYPGREVQQAFSKDKLEDALTLPGELFVDGEPLLATSLPDEVTLKFFNQSGYNLRQQDLKRRSVVIPRVGLSEEQLTDLFNSENSLSDIVREVKYIPDNRWTVEFTNKKRPVTRLDIVTMFLKKKLLGGIVLELPTPIRKSMIDKPVSEHGSIDELCIAAATIDPPFERVEIERMIDRGGEDAAKALLEVKRTNDVAGRILANYPSEAGAALARKGKLPADVLDEMVTAGDPMVRKEAVTAPNLTEENARTLATDPDEDVRLSTVATERRGWSDTVPILDQYPNLIITFANDPSDEVAKKAFASAPINRTMLLAINGVTTRRRLELIKETIASKQYVADHPEFKQALALIDARLSS